MRSFAIVVALAVAAVSTACSSSNDSTSASATSSPSASPSTTGTAMQMGGDEESFDFGEPAEAGEADRTIDITMQDTFRFEPDSVNVSTGETVAFRLHNEGQIAHEFVLGDKELQKEHEQEMQAMEGGEMMADEPNAVDVAPGGSKTLAFHFTQAGELQYACHQPGHYAAGMIGTITVS